MEWGRGESTQEDEKLALCGYLPILIALLKYMHEEWLNRECCSWLCQVSKPLLGILLAVDWLHLYILPWAASGSHKRQARIAWPAPAQRQQLMSCRSSGVGDKGATVWFTGKRRGRNKWLLYWIMLCGSLGRKHPEASQSQMTEMGIVTERRPQIWL